MRWLFATLALVNLGLLMWASWHREGAGDAGRQARPSVNAEQMVPLPAPRPAPRPAVPESATPPSRSPPAPPAAAAASPGRCYAVGPFDTRGQAGPAGDRLKGMGLEYQLVSAPDPIEAGCWVFLPPLAGAAAVQQKIAELSAMGIHDHYVVREGTMQNAISLGVFSRRPNAERRLQELARRGIPARLGPYRRTRSVYWLQLWVAAPAVEQGQALQQAQWEGSGVRLRAIECPAGLGATSSPVGRADRAR
jgi:hypothetical protein